MHLGSSSSKDGSLLMRLATDNRSSQAEFGLDSSQHRHQLATPSSSAVRYLTLHKGEFVIFLSSDLSDLAVVLHVQATRGIATI